MRTTEAAQATADAVEALRRLGAKFAYLHGSRSTSRQRPGSDIDIAAFFGDGAPQAFEVLMPPGVDLLVLDHAPLELAGRVAITGRLIFDDDAPTRVRWEATTRKIYFDERSRFERSHREFIEHAARGLGT